MAMNGEFMGMRADGYKPVLQGPAPSTSPTGPYRLACFWRRVRESAIMAMNSEFVGLPLMFETV